MRETLQKLVDKMNEDPSGLDHLSATYNFILSEGDNTPLNFLTKVWS